MLRSYVKIAEPRAKPAEARPTDHPVDPNWDPWVAGTVFSIRIEIDELIGYEPVDPLAVPLVGIPLYRPIYEGSFLVPGLVNPTPEQEHAACLHKAQLESDAHDRAWGPKPAGAIPIGKPIDPANKAKHSELAVEPVEVAAPSATE